MDGTSWLHEATNEQLNDGWSLPSLFECKRVHNVINNTIYDGYTTL